MLEEETLEAEDEEKSDNVYLHSTQSEARLKQSLYQTLVVVSSAYHTPGDSGFSCHMHVSLKCTQNTRHSYNQPEECVTMELSLITYLLILDETSITIGKSGHEMIRNDTRKQMQQFIRRYEWPLFLML